MDFKRIAFFWRQNLFLCVSVFPISKISVLSYLLKHVNCQILTGEFHYVGRTEITPFSVNFGKASFAFFLVINKKLEWGSISNKLLLVGFSFSFNVSVNAVCFSSISSFVNIYGFLMDKTFLWMVSQFHKKEPMANPHLKKIVFYSII